LGQGAARFPFATATVVVVVNGYVLNDPQALQSWVQPVYATRTSWSVASDGSRSDDQRRQAATQARRRGFLRRERAGTVLAV
jgi:hypothetical protein